MELFNSFCLDCGKIELNCEEILSSRNDLIADSFEFPVGSASGGGYYIAQRFGEENPRFRGKKHLGEDWNYKGGGDSDYAAPVYSIGTGLVTQVKTFGGGWGKVIRVCHRLSPRLQRDFGYRFLESIYAHLYDFQVEEGDAVGEGQWIGSIGDADGLYVAHLHFELRTKV
ncbi:MAG: M23 family metallopeptidase, partial [Leptospira sp.]|nr:M23 family metallopeptidase [Leptospira sp.]